MTIPNRLESLLPYAAALTAGALPAYLLRYSIFGIPTTVLEILIYIFVFLVVISRWGKFCLPPVHIRWIILLFVAAALVSTIIAPDKREALGILKAWVFDPLAFVWALWQLPDRRATTFFVITGLVAGALIVSSIAVVQRFIGDLTVDGRVVGPFAWFPEENASPNYLALYLAPLAVLAAGIGIGSLAARRKRGLLIILGAALITAAIYFSLSRAGLAAVGIGTAAMLIVRYWFWIKTRAWVKFLLIACIAAAIFGSWFAIRPDPLLSPEEGGRITASNNVRWEIWKVTMQEIIPANTVFGIGLGNFQDYFTELTAGRVNYDRIAPLALTPHNLFLSLWVNLGLLGLAAFVWMPLIIFQEGLRRVGREMRGNEGKSSKSFIIPFHPSIPLLGALVALFAHGLLDTPYFKNDLSMLFWILTATLLLLSTEETRERLKS